MSEATENPRIERLAPGAYRTYGPTATGELGELLGALLQEGDVLVLSGDLGAGKTCLTGGVARGLGDSSRVTSPTFTIMCVHDGGRIPLYHFDLYRLEDAVQLDDVGIFDLLEADGACLVEWGDLFIDELGEDRLDVALMRDDATGEPGCEPPRRLTLAPHGARAGALAAALDEAVVARL